MSGKILLNKGILIIAIPMRVLITGFPPFPGRPINPTQQLVDAINHGVLSMEAVELFAELVPVEYRTVEKDFDQLIAELAPNLVLSFGVGRHQNSLRLETLGVNLDHASIPDNAGELRENHVIVPGAPPELPNLADLGSLAQAIHLQGVPVELSENAGRYVCNHLLYYATIRQSQVTPRYDFLFTHVPTLENGFEMDLTLKGIEVMIKWYQSHGALPDHAAQQ